MTKRREVLQILVLVLALSGCVGLLSGCMASKSSATTPTPSPTPTPAPSPHTVALSWSASPSPNLQGYRVYRSQVSGGPYNGISGTLTATTLAFTDSTVSSSQSYFYVITSLDVNGLESAPSMEVSAQIP